MARVRRSSSARKSYQAAPVAENAKAFRITVKGLRGGHSGMDIHRGFGNANKMMNRILFALSPHISIAQIDGGSLRNAIPRESNAIVTCTDATQVQVAFAQITKQIDDEYRSTEGGLELLLDDAELPASVLTDNEQKNLIKSTYAIHNGVFRMSPDIDDLVETSNSLARIVVKDGEIKISCLTRSSVDSGKMDLAYQLKSGLELGGFEVELSGSYPGWKPNPDSAILKVMEGIYADIFDQKPNVMACHAGLECGILGTNYPQMDMISFGPNIRGAHSPDERVSISSTQKYWKYLLEILKNIPKK